MGRRTIRYPWPLEHRQESSCDCPFRIPKWSENRSCPSVFRAIGLPRRTGSIARYLYSCARPSCLKTRLVAKARALLHKSCIKLPPRHPARLPAPWPMPSGRSTNSFARCATLHFKQLVVLHKVPKNFDITPYLAGFVESHDTRPFRRRSGRKQNLAIPAASHAELNPDPCSTHRHARARENVRKLEQKCAFGGQSKACLDALSGKFSVATRSYSVIFLVSNC